MAEILGLSKENLQTLITSLKEVCKQLDKVQVLQAVQEELDKKEDKTNEELLKAKMGIVGLLQGAKNYFREFNPSVNVDDIPIDTQMQQTLSGVVDLVKNFKSQEWVLLQQLLAADIEFKDTQGRNILDVLPGVLSNYADTAPIEVVNNLTDGGADKALSAEQGKVLFQNVDDGKQILANAIIDKGGTGVSKESTFQELAAAIESLNVGGSSEPEYIPQTVGDTPMHYNSTVQTFLRNNRSRMVVFPNVFRPLSNSGQNMFAECSELRIVPGINMSHITTARIMFVGAPNLEYVGALKTSNKLTNVSEMFRGCSKLKFVTKFDISGVTDFSDIFKGCSSLNIAKMRAAGWPEEYLQTAPNYRAP